MSIYLLLYICVIVSLSHIAYLVYKKYRFFLHGKYLLAAIICFTLWLIFYVIAFSTTIDSDKLLVLSRLMYSLSLVAVYSMIFFALFFSSITKNKYKNVNKILLAWSATIGGITLLSPLVIKGMVFDTSLGFYYEDFGSLFLIYEILYLANPIAFIIIARKKIQTLKGISKMRFKYICIGYSIFMLNFAFFLGILPMFDIWVMQKQQILFFIPFIIGIYYSIQRYHFITPFVGLGRIFIAINALLFSTILTNTIHEHYISKIGSLVNNFWSIEENIGLIHTLIGILIFLGTYKFLTSKLLISTNHDKFIEKLEKIKTKVPFITNLNDLNAFLKSSFNNSLSISNAEIGFFSNKGSKKPEIYNFFQGNIKNKYFMNDITFIEENKHKFNKEKIKKEIPLETSVILPMKKSQGDIIGILSLGHKPLKDVYMVEQIKELEKFSDFLTGHLKYIDIYKNIHDLNINLDKKVDEKTIEYNNLISKQKEFISVVSHEMRSPITTAIFQTDCILDDIDAGKLEKTHLETELKSLYSQLTRSSDLVKKLFSVEKYDINKFSLFKEEVSLYDFLKKEIHHFTKNNTKIDFDLNIDKNLGNIKIDQVQFRQVIDNLINNAIKFADEKNPKISFSAEASQKDIQIKIEDNGRGFKDTDITSIFDKYFTGKSSSIGIGIGLYLCKKIVEFHNGEIQAKFSNKLGGGKFIITIPK